MLGEILVPRESLAPLELKEPLEMLVRRAREALAVSLVVLDLSDPLELVEAQVPVDSLVLMEPVALREDLVSVVPTALWVPRVQLARLVVLESLVCPDPRV